MYWGAIFQLFFILFFVWRVLLFFDLGGEGITSPRACRAFTFVLVLWDVTTKVNNPDKNREGSKKVIAHMGRICRKKELCKSICRSPLRGSFTWKPHTGFHFFSKRSLSHTGFWAGVVVYIRVVKNQNILKEFPTSLAGGRNVFK